MSARRGAPMHWEPQPSLGGRAGPAPRTRVGHQAATLDFPAGLVYVYGGLVVDGSETHGFKAVPGVWSYDSRAQSWTEVAEVQAATAPPVLPRVRAFHTMTSIGESALVCGGQGGNEPGPSRAELISDPSGERMDCWWLTPSSYLAVDWEPLHLRAGSAGPHARSAHTMTFDPISGALVLWGGLGNTTALNDCWFIRTRERLSLSDAAKFSAQRAPYVWHRCDIGPPAQDLQDVPSARWGHVAVFFQSRLYIQGGISREHGLGMRTRDDMWVLLNFDDISARVWDMIQPLSPQSPAGRAFHSAWLVGLKLCLVGGQGETGRGFGLALDETWCYHLVPNTWVRLSPSAQTPAVSHLALVALHSSGTALAFGGQDRAALPTAALFEFSPLNSRWKRVTLSGPSPSRRAGHVSFLNSHTSEMYIALGQSVLPGSRSLMNDLWVFDCSTSMWQCIKGEHAGCLNSLPTDSTTIPEPIAFAASATLGGLNLGVTFGGFSLLERTTDPSLPGSLPRFSNVSRTVPVNYGRAWTLHLDGRQKYRWQEVVTANKVMPRARGFSTILALEPFNFQNAKMENPLILFGGADWSCFSQGCQLPKPLSDLWLIDMKQAPIAKGSTNPDSTRARQTLARDQTAEFDGVDDLVDIPLPPWCDERRSVGVVWIDFWMRYTRSAISNSYLIEALSGREQTDTQLRWFIEGAHEEVYVKLVLRPGDQQQLVRRWGPIPSTSAVGVWHHVTFTLRTSPVFSAQIEPSLMIAQAFFFLDFEQVPMSSTADIDETLILNSGLSRIVLGGVSSSTGKGSTKRFEFFEGAVDDFRVWWRACPIATDPSSCDPFAFAPLRLRDGTSVTTVRRSDGRPIQLKDVAFDDVAMPVRVHTFSKDDPRLTPSIYRDREAAAARAKDGLILHLDFNAAPALDGALLGPGPVSNDRPLDTSIMPAPAYCSVVLPPPTSSSFGRSVKTVTTTCPTCPEQCTIARSHHFVTSTIQASWFGDGVYPTLGVLDQAESDRGSDPDGSIAFFSEWGWCECLDADKCPTSGRCHCPSNYVRVCEDCAIVGVCSAGSRIGVPCDLSSAFAPGQGGCMSPENSTDEGTRDVDSSNSSQAEPTGVGSLCVALDAMGCPESKCRSWRCQALLLVSSDVFPIDTANASEHEDTSDEVEPSENNGNATACPDGNSTDSNTSACQDGEGAPRMKAVTMCRTRVDSHGESHTDEATDESYRQSLPDVSVSPSVGFSCAPNQTLIHSKPGKRQQCCSLLKNGGVLRGHFCRHWTPRSNEEHSEELEANSELVCESLQVPSPKWEHDCGIRACCVDTDSLLLAMHFEDLAAIAQTEDSGCYTFLPQTYVGEDDMSPPKPIKTCSLPQGSLLTTTFRTDLLDAMIQEFSPLLEEALAKWHPPSSDGNSSNATDGSSEVEEEADPAGRRRHLLSIETELRPDRRVQRRRVSPLEKLFLRAEVEGEGEEAAADVNATSCNSTDCEGGNAATGEEEGDDIEMTCKESPGAETPVEVPVWVSTCGNEFGFPLFLKPGPPSYAEFHVVFTDPIGPMTHRQLSNLVQLTSFMVGIHKSERHLISVRQMLQTKTGDLRAAVRISTPCPAGAIELRRVITDRLQAVGTGNNDEDSNSTNATAADDDETAEEEAAAAARRRHMRGLLQDESVDEGGDGGNSSNTTAAQQGGDAPDEGEESIFVFTSWSAGSDFFELPASVAGGESARYCGDGVVDVHEECDDGTGNGPAFRCSSACRCNPGYSLVPLRPPLPWLIDERNPQGGGDDVGRDQDVDPRVCACNFNSEFSATASESSSEISAQNDITFELSFTKPVRGAAPLGGDESHSYAPVEIQISNLTGIPVPDGILTIKCVASSWGMCHVGIPNVAFGPPKEPDDTTQGESQDVDNSTDAGSETEATPEAEARMWATVTDKLLRSMATENEWRFPSRHLLQEDVTAEDNATNITDAQKPPVDHWRRSAATWERKSGTLKFFILEDLPADTALRVTITLVNRNVAQPPRLARINACARGKQVDANSGVLASNTVTIFQPGAGVSSEEDSEARRRLLLSVHRGMERSVVFPESTRKSGGLSPLQKLALRNGVAENIADEGSQEPSVVLNSFMCSSYPCTYTLRQASEHGHIDEVADVFLASPPHNDSVLRIVMWTDENQALDRPENAQLKALMQGKLQEGSALAGYNGAILGLTWTGEAVDVQVTLRVNNRTLRRQAGCRTVTSNVKSDSWNGGRLELCLSGKVALHTFDMHSKLWSPATEHTTNLSEVLTANITDWSSSGQDDGGTVTGNTTFLAAVASLRCCNGRSCGDAVCPPARAAAEALDAAQSPPKRQENRVKLGGGVGIRMPAIQPSQRPFFDEVHELQAYVTRTVSGTKNAAQSQIYVPASNWTQLCPTFPTPTSFAVTATQNQECPPENVWTTSAIDKGREWPPARYAHALQTSLRHDVVLIYGGVGCARYAEGDVNGFCLAAQVLDDLWQFDVSNQTFRKIQFNDKLSPNFGHLLVKVPDGGVGGGRGGADMLVIGGSQSFYSHEPLWGKPRPRSVTTTVTTTTLSSKPTTAATTLSRAATSDSFVLRHLYLLENRSTAQFVSPSQVGGLWGGTVVTNSSHAFIFGGFEANALSNAVYIYDLRETHHTDMQVAGIQKIVSAAHRPSASAFSRVNSVNSTFAVWTGGVIRDPVSDSLMPQTDIWALSTTGTEFGMGVRVPHFYTPSNLPTSHPSFSATFAYEVDGFVLLVSHGGFVVRHSMVQNTAVQLRTHQANLHVELPDLEGFRVYLLARADGSTIGWGDKIINGLSCPLNQVAVVNHGCVRGAPAFNPEGWVCANSGSSSEAYCSYDVGPSACAWCESNGGTASGISTGIREMNLITSETHMQFCPAGAKDGNDVNDLLYAPDPQHDVWKCTPTARFMQTLTRGTFLGGHSAVMYGGLDHNGNALSDLWLLDLDAAHPGHQVDVEWRGSNSSMFNVSDYLSSVAACDSIDAHVSNLKFYDVIVSGGGSATYQCLTCGENMSGANKGNDAHVVGKRLVFIVKSTKVQCVNPGKAKAWADEQKLQLQMAPSLEEWTVRRLPDTLTVPMWQYAQPVSSGTNSKMPANQSDVLHPCRVVGELPGPRHGHVAVAVQLQQLQNSALLIYGGESTHLDASHAQMSSDLHIAVFETYEVSVAKPTLVDDVGKPCNSGGNCPQARRDAASLLAGSDQDRTSRLFIFGGLTHKHPLKSSSFSSPLRAYLDGDSSLIKPLDDLWYLDLSELTNICNNGRTRTICRSTVLTWTRVLVATPYFAGEHGGQALRRWGATMIMDPSADALVLLGGASVENTSVSRGRSDRAPRGLGVGQLIMEHADAFALPLRKVSRCHVLEAPTRTEVGAITSFKVQCTDALGHASTSASVSAKFSGPENLECLCESGASSSGESSDYVCRVSALMAGFYRVVVIVAESKMSSEHSTQLAPFSVNVEASSAFWPLSEVRTARSQDVHATAGNMADFIIVAKDRYGNLARETSVPVDFMLVLHIDDTTSLQDVPARRQALVSPATYEGKNMTEDELLLLDRYREEEGSIVESAAAAMDAGSLLNWFMDSEGVYKVNYWVTRSGSYSIQAVSSSGLASHSIVGPSPGVLLVTSCAAAIENSYVFGQVANAVAGRTSELYVQMRDRFGNKVAHSELMPYQDLQVNLCLKIGGMQGQSCGGIDGFRSHDISVSTEHTGSAGVYKLTLDFFRDGTFILLVLHNMTILNCYFDFPRNPGHQMADMCTKQATLVPTRLTAVLGAKFNADGEEIDATPVSTDPNSDRRLLKASATRRQSDAKLLGPDGSSRSPAPSSNVGGAAYTLQLYTLANISVSVKPVFEPPDLRIMQQMLLYLPLAAACAALLLQGVCYFFSAIREPTYSSHLEEHNVVVTTNSIRVSKQNHRNARARQAAEARKEQIGKQEKSSKEDVDKSDSVSTRPTHSDESFATSPTSRFGLKPFEQPAKTSLRQSDPAAGVVPKGFGTSDRSKGRSVSWTPQPPSGSDSDPAAGGVRIEGDESARKSARVSPSQGSPSQKSTSTDAYRDPSVVDQFLSRSLSAEAIRTLKDIKGVSLRAPSSIVVTTTPGSRLVRTHDQPVSLEAITTKLDLGAKSDHSSKAHLAATNPHSESDENIGDKGVAGAHPVRQEDDPDSGVGVADAGAEVAGDAPDPLSPKRKKSPQQLVFKPDIRQTPPSSPKSISGPTLLDIDGCLDYVTLLEDDKVISADEAILGRQAVLRGDPKVTAVLKDRAVQGQKWRIAAAIRQLHDSMSSSPAPHLALGGDAGGGAISLSSRSRLTNFFGRGVGGAEVGKKSA